jgi:hypothetical protein
MTPSHHLRESSGGVTHYVDNRTITTLCGASAINWALVLDGRQVPTCEKCVKLLDNVEIQP